MSTIKIVKKRPIYYKGERVYFSLSTPYLKEAKDYAKKMVEMGHKKVVIHKTKNIISPFHSKNKWRYEVFRDKY